MSNRNMIPSTHTCDLDLPGLSPQIGQANLLPDLTSHALISISQLCDAGYYFLLNKKLQYLPQE